MKHEAKFSVVSPKGSYTPIQVETFEQAAARYGINVQFPLKSDATGNLILSSGLNLRDAQMLRKQVAGYGFPVDVVSDESQIDPITTNERDITSSTTMALRAPSFDDIESWEDVANPPLLNIDSFTDESANKDVVPDNPTEHPTTEHVMSLSDDELLEVCRNSDENTSDDELRKKIAACLPTNEMKLSDDMRANLFSDIDSDVGNSLGHSVYRYKGTANNNRDTFRRNSNIQRPASSLGRSSSLGTRSVNSTLPKFGGLTQSRDRLGNSGLTSVRSSSPRYPEPPKPAAPIQEPAKEPVQAPVIPEIPAQNAAPVAEPPRRSVPVISDLQNLPEGLAGSESLAILIRPPHQDSDPDDNDLDDIFDTLPAPKDEKPRAPKSTQSDEVKRNEDKRIDNIIENLKPTAAAESKPETAPASSNAVAEAPKPTDEKPVARVITETQSEEIDEAKKQLQKKIIIAVVFVVIVLAVALAILL
ncbi:MAG: hypothetical protein IJU23_09585 [Proteobacteria bacterium]|nr:hypothetical protein [Pseudomonadota bacterium]